MSLKLMYLTNDIAVAKIAQETGVDRIVVDLEMLGKEERQRNMNTVKSNHTIADVKKIKNVMNESELLVRVNPINSNSRMEINKVIEYGADIIMLPMFKTVQEVEQFIEFVDKRAIACLLLETKEAKDCLEEILNVKGIDEIHIGLNDLHLSYGKKFMFELLTDGTVKDICNCVKARGIPYGFGGIAALGMGTLPADLIVAEHYHLGSQMVILSRSFCNINDKKDLPLVRDIFKRGITELRAYEKRLETYTEADFEENYNLLVSVVKQVVCDKTNA